MNPQEIDLAALPAVPLAERAAPGRMRMNRGMRLVLDRLHRAAVWAEDTYEARRGRDAVWAAIHQLARLTDRLLWRATLTRS